MPATARSERREAEDKHRERVKPCLAMAEEEHHEGDVDQRARDDDLIPDGPIFGFIAAHQTSQAHEMRTR